MRAIVDLHGRVPIGNLTAETLKGSSGRASATRGVYRLHYTYNDEPASMVFKLTQFAHGADPRWTGTGGSTPRMRWPMGERETAFDRTTLRKSFDWRKEFNYYNDPVLSSPIGGVRTPLPYVLWGSIPAENAVIAMEDVKGKPAQQWNVREYSEAFRRLGFMQGVFFLRLSAGARMPASWGEETSLPNTRVEPNTISPLTAIHEHGDILGWIRSGRQMEVADLFVSLQKPPGNCGRNW